MKNKSLYPLIVVGYLILVGIVLVSDDGVDQKNLNNDSKNHLEHVSSIDSIIKTLYDVISGEKGEPRNWELFEYLFHPEGRMINYAPNKEGEWNLLVRNPSAYIKSSGKYFEKTGFYEEEFYKEVDSFGNIAVVKSFYASYYSKSDTVPFMRGYNSFHLLYHNDRWWIVTNYWMRETEQFPIQIITNATEQK